MSKFITCTIANIRTETADTISIAINVPLASAPLFKFIQGQYITFKLHINGEEVRRSYSICSGVNDGEIRVAVKRVGGGKGSNYMIDTFKVNDTVEVMPPTGNFYSVLSASNSKHYVLFAGGSGITPMLSIIKSVLVTEPNSTLTLVYGNRDEQSVVFNAELTALQANNNNKLKVINVLENSTDTVFGGRLDKAKNKLLFSNNTLSTNANNIYFICGPTPMMDAVRETLEDLNVDKKTIHIEYFSAPVDVTPVVKSDVSVDANVTVILDGDEFTIKLRANQTVLEAVLNAGYDAPYACQGGSCCTCRALLTEGAADMITNYALLEDEVQQGYVLTCQCIAKTPTLTINYDRGN
ncbi:MAG: 2Fe-2S iron-sulfur cluster binding domain-containing protein [Bacteroidia bacterium]|nr:2Fe-2S iron-sulfur cluster binding domain-containing protein [Bacteroidia bacterium]